MARPRRSPHLRAPQLNCPVPAVTSASVRQVVNDLPTQTRQGLQAALDGAVLQTSDQAARTQLAAGSTPLGSEATQLATVFADRAQAVTQLRAAVYGFLGMQPTAPADAPASSATTGAGGTAITGGTAQLSATEATNRIAAAGALLSHSDALYRSVRTALAAAPGHGRLPPSVWVTHPQVWQPGSVAAQVDLVATSPTLAATHDVVLRTVRVTPPALPTPQGAPPAVSVISPTSRIGVTVVVSNQAPSNEPHVAVHVILANQTSGATTTQVRTTPLALGASVTLPTVTMRVKPSTTYVLTVQVVLPGGQSLTANTEIQQTLQVAAGT